jgi:predicted transcriptional regulator
MNMMKSARRDTLKIIADLLQNMREPRRLTHLLYASNLSYSQLSKYLKIVKEMGMAIEQKKPYHTYIVTQDGEFFIQLVNKRELLKIRTT